MKVAYRLLVCLLYMSSVLTPLLHLDTEILQADGWRYAPGQDGQKAWQKLLMPVSSCSKADLTKKDNWQGVSVRRKRQHLQEVAAGSIEVAATDLDPPAMPPDVLELARLFSSRPEAW